MSRIIYLKENEAIEELDRPLLQVVHRLDAGAQPVIEIYDYTLGLRPVLVASRTGALSTALDEAKEHARRRSIELIYVLDLASELNAEFNEVA